jgi:hypothetical protein
MRALQIAFILGEPKLLVDNRASVRGFCFPANCSDGLLVILVSVLASRFPFPIVLGSE